LLTGLSPAWHGLAAIGRLRALLAFRQHRYQLASPSSEAAV